MRKGRTSEAARQQRLANHHGKKKLLLTIGETAMSSGAEVPVYGQVTMAPFGTRPLGLDALSRYEALLSVSRAIARHTSVAGLLRAIGDQLHLVVPFDYLMLILHDASTDEMRLVVLEPSNTPFVPFVPLLLSDWGPARSAWETQRTSVVPLLTEALLGSGLDVIRGQGARVTCWLPLTTAHWRVGVLSFGSRDADRYGADAVAFMEQVAAHVAIAVDNAINFDDAQRLQGEREANGTACGCCST